MSKEKIAELILDVFAIPGFAIQFIEEVPFEWKIFLWIVSGISFVVLAILIFYDKKIISRKNLIKKGKKILNNTNQKAVLFGGDLSWKKDYIENINHLLKNTKEIEIIIPKDKIETHNQMAKTKLITDIQEFKNLGAEIYITQTDLHMRGFIIDPELLYANIKTHMLFAKKISTNSKNQEKNKYSFEELNSKKDNEMYAIMYNLYKQIKQTSTKY